MRTISVRQPVALALLHNRCGIVGKYHPFVDKHFGLHCSTQGGLNSAAGEILQKAGLLPPTYFPDHSAPKGSVLASCQIVGCLARTGSFGAKRSMREVVAVLRARMFEVAGTSSVMEMSSEAMRAWLQIAGTSEWLYILANVRPCHPVLWRGVASCFPVPDNVFDVISALSI